MHSYIHYYPENFESNSLEWTVKIREIPQIGYWFFALAFYIKVPFQGKQVGGYVGLQLVDRDKKAIFSLWYSTDAEAYNGFVVNDIEEDGAVKRILGHYDWQKNKPYRFRLECEKSDITLSIYDENNILIKIGKQKLPENLSWADLSPKVDLFMEWLDINEPTKPVEVVFSDFSPRPKALIIEEDNTLNSYIEILDNCGTFVLR